MGRIKKAAGPKHEATVSPAIAAFVAKAATLPVARLPAHLRTFPRQWPFPRGDLYHWIPLLNRFDLILEHFNQAYALHTGPQTTPFQRVLLEQGVAEEGKDGERASSSPEELDILGFPQDGDKLLAQTILAFSRQLIENCGNRSLYSSSDRLGDLLNTIDLSLLADALQLAVRLAQRYHASRQRGTSANQHLNHALLATHYNIDLEKVQRLANPFIKSASSADTDPRSAPNGTLTTKGKDKTRSSSRSQPVTPIQSSDIVAIAGEQAPKANGSIGRKASSVSESHQSDWEAWGSVQMRYYQPPPPSEENARIMTPTTPTPTRRPSNLSRSSRPSTVEEPPDTPSPASTNKSDEPGHGRMKSLDIPLSRISSTPLLDILKDTVSNIPKDHQYELLTRLRVAHAMTTSFSTRQALLVVRLLALTNLAYIYPDATFQQKILQQDSDEPRRLQLAYQLAELLQHSANGSSGVLLRLQTVAFEALESLTKHKARGADVCAALNINVNHGVLLQNLKKAATDMGTEDGAGEESDADREEWREALFSLLDTLPSSSPRAGETLIGAGLFDILIETLNLRTNKAEAHHHKALTFLNTIVYANRDAFQTFANAKGLDTISDLVAFEVSSSMDRADNGRGIPVEYRNQVIDYQIPYFQQQTLRWLFKFVNHMMAHSGGNFDRLLRNLIDSPQLLGGLKVVITNAKTFGSSVWSSAVNILSSFIHNEPTSYSIIAEAGLSKSFLESVSSQPIVDSKTSEGSEAEPASTEPQGNATASTNIAPTPENSEQSTAPASKSMLNDRSHPLAQGILPATDAIVTIPQAFGAICLNNAGLNLFLRSQALERFFEIFESQEHIKSMGGESELPRLLGSSFDELVRHYPQLKQPVMESIMLMVRRVCALCKDRAKKQGLGAKLWINVGNGKPEIAGGLGALKADTGEPNHEGFTVLQRQDSDVIMQDADTSGEDQLINADFDRLAADAKADEVTYGYIGSAMKFLGGFFENTNGCSAFIDAGGAESVLEFATLPSVQYDFSNDRASHETARVIHMLVEQKPHLVMPSLLIHTQKAIDVLEPLYNHAASSAFFAKYTTPNQTVSEDPEHPSTNGTSIVKHLLAVHTLCNVLYEVFSPPIYNARSSHTVFTQVNLSDMYIKLIESFGKLNRTCVWEDILLQNSIPDSWKEATRVKGFGIGSQEADEIFGFLPPDEPLFGSDEASQDAAADESGNGGIVNAVSTDSNHQKRRQSSIRRDENMPQFRNARTLRYLLSQLPASITPFLQGLGKALIAKRRPDTYARQSAHMVAEAMSTSILEQLKFSAPKDASSVKDRQSYWIVILTSLSQLLMEGNVDMFGGVRNRRLTIAGPVDHPSPQCLTLVLHAFKAAGGLHEIKSLLEIFVEEARMQFANTGKEDSTEGHFRLATAYGGIRMILSLYTQITAPKAIAESPQTTAMQSNERDRGTPYYFLPPQFLVELRMAVLPVVRSIWDSDFVDKAPNPIVKCLVEILRTGLESNEEQGAYRRGDKLPMRAKHSHKVYNISEERVKSLKDQGFEPDLAREALYRCYNGQHAAEEYCEARQNHRVSQNPIPEYDLEKKEPSPTVTPRQEDPQSATSDSGRMEASVEDPLPTDEQTSSADSGSSTQSDPPGTETMTADAGNVGGGLPAPPPAPGVPTDTAAMDIDNLFNMADIMGVHLTGQGLGGLDSGRATPPMSEAPLVPTSKVPDLVTINDLDEERSAIRENLIERALDVLNVHSDVTFELADLIGAAASKASDSSSMRRDIGETLVQSLISLQLDEDFRPAGKKIAAYANLLALVLQDDDFYQATLDELRSNFSQLLSFIKIFPDQKAEEASPWIGQVLLVVERVLSEDAQPTKVQWTQPSPDSDLNTASVAVLEDPVLSLNDKMSLFDALIEILPRIGKDESLALSVVRALVIITRVRSIAERLVEKKNIQRLFVMVKQLAGNINERLQSSLMVVLRHIVEDDDTIRQIMRREIAQNFESRPSRPSDTTSYVRQMYPLVLRAPEIFVEITNEKLEIKDLDLGSNPRPQILSLKPEPEVEETAKPETEDDENQHKEEVSKAETSSEKDSIEPAKEPIQKSKGSEIRTPAVETPSGVIHYILCELFSYKEVDDKDPAATKRNPSEAGSQGTSTDIAVEGSSRDVESEGLWVSTGTSSVRSASPNDETGPKKAEKPEFKAEQHPIYMYRCFLLQCLTELLLSYGRTKFEFINFSRKADPKAATPSKPRSGVLNYLLNDLIPLGTLDHEETVAFRKKSTTSNWALSVVVALCLMSNEPGYGKRRGPVDEIDDAELLFVRKFVLEHALKAYKDANASTEALNVKYSRLLCLADLFDRLLQGRLVQANSGNTNGVANTQQQIAKLMFERNFLSALTSSIADIDLNYPQSRRAVKYILKPLKQLTSTAIHLSETSSIPTTLGQTEDDAISSATSVSEMDEEREETPDLFRNSTLGMFEPGRGEGSSSESSDGDDEEMYDDEYDDGMEYEEEIERDADEVISDEEDDEAGAGHMEGLPGDVGMDVEVVIDGDEGSPSEEDDGDEGGSEGMNDIDDNDLEVLEEIAGDDNNSLADGDEEEWQDEDEIEDNGFAQETGDLAADGGGGEDAPDGEDGITRRRVRAAIQRFHDEGAIDMDLEADAYPDDGMQEEEEEEEEEEDDEDQADDGDLVYQADYADDEQDVPDPPWGWDPDEEGNMPPTRHHHHSRRIVSPWTIFPSGHASDRSGMAHSYHRSHRPTGGPRTADDGTNPLLRRHDDNGSSPSGGRSSSRFGLSDPTAGMGDFWVHGMDPSPFPRSPLARDSPVSFVNNLIAAIGQGGPGLNAATLGAPDGGALHFHIGGGPGGGRGGVIPRELQAILGLRPPPPEVARNPRNDTDQVTAFIPQVTHIRWQEEARLLFGAAHTEKAQRVINALLRALVPPAMAKKKREEEEARLLMEAREKALEEERRIREEKEAAEKEAAEKEAKEKQEREEQEDRENVAVAQAEGEQTAAGLDAGQPSDQPPEFEITEEEDDEDEEGDADGNDGAMEGVDTAQIDGSGSEDDEAAEAPASVEEPAAASTSATEERVRTTIRGRELDITGMGVDLEYLEALPEDLREEVLMHQLALQRSQAVAAGEAPSDISREFLEALPPDIREELLQQEAQDRRRREREEERRRRAAETGAPARAEEMDPASFLASLDPGLRQAVLMDQDEEVLNQLPQAIAAEARALGVDRGYRGYQGIPGHSRARMHNQERESREARLEKKAPRKQIVQMLDKAGVATLLRLMFIQQQGSSRQSLNNILHDISQNRQTRAEVISLLLSILQDGSTDVNAVERSFAHLSLRAKQPATQKTPQPLKRSLTNNMVSTTNSEMTPLMVVQQCLSSLVFLTQYNPHIPSFFLTEHEVSSGLRSKPNRKGKGKETKAQKFALNALLSLLDRKLIMESSSCMEQLSSLLQAVTHPLTMLLRHNKDKPEEAQEVETNDQPMQDSESVAVTAEVQTGQSDAQSAGPASVETRTEIPTAAGENPPVEGPVAGDPATENGTTSAESKPRESSKSEDEKAKKQRALSPPVVPEENLRLVVNILAARECSAKTFRDTLSTINNLSAIPEARQVFGKGLVEQAQELGQSIYDDLDKLVLQIKQADSSTDVQGMALAKFSPTSSDQAKLLRVLTALDYLFDPKRNNGRTTSVADDKVQTDDSSKSKEDILTSLYEHPTFGALWTRLSDCLSAVRQGEGTLNIATILLPLIEALMVVCKNTAIKDSPLVKAAKEFTVASPPPESGIENLFFRFTEEHRKILNDLVRQNPKLMSGTFSLLVKNPKVLEFDNKRNYFNRRLHSRGAEARHPQPPLQLNVRRDQVFLDSYKFMHFKSGDEIKYGKLSIRFHGEEGVDAGGVTREWFQVLSRQMFNPDYALFVPVASDRTTFHPNKLSKVNEEHLDFFKFIGRIIGKALYEGRALDCHFSRAVYKRILGKSVSIKDMETLDLDYYKSLLWMLENDITEIITETFSIETDDFGVTEIVDLIENGRNIPVTEDNKHEYVQRMVEYRLTGSVQAQLEKFLGGFHDVVSPELIAIFNEQELELLISGLPDIDVEDWKNNTEYHNYSASSSQIQWFWRAVRSFDKEERAKLLQFVTGTSKVPLNGFGQLEGMNGFSRFNIHRDYGNKDQLDLPEYDSYEQLRQQVYTAMTAGSEYFGFA
ncbi:MAG: hypothetical protein Q9219_005556 [cf. Caloplaca sp. 3 TL-2023]